MSHDKPGLLVALAQGSDPGAWVEAFATVLPAFEVMTLGERPAPGRVRYAAAWNAPCGSLGRYPDLHAIFSLGAGVDHLMRDPGLPDGVPLVRVVDPDLTNRMSEWVALHVLLHHRQQRRYDDQQRRTVWDDDVGQPAARDVRVGIMGLGVLGQDAARKLAGLGFDVAGWSRSPKLIEGIATYAGGSQFDDFLGRTQMLVALLPLTAATAGILDRTLFARLARDGHLGAPVLINGGRGGLQNETDILAALDDGTLGGATLDVFEREPLPPRSPLWHHPRVTITPHNAAISNPQAVAGYIAGQIRRLENGQPLRYTVDRTEQY